MVFSESLHIIFMKYFNLNNTINRKRKGKLLPKNKEISEWINTWKLEWYISVITDAFLDQKRINVCEHMVARSHIFTLFWSRKASVIAEKYHSSFRVFVCDFHLEICSFFDKNFPFLFKFSVLSILRYFPFHVVYFKT